MHIERTDAWLARPEADEVVLERPDMVGQWEWCRLIPDLHRILANPDGGHGFPRFRKDMDLGQSCAYWETAYYLLRRLLGWRDIGLGLQWWFSAGKPTLDDVRLTALKRIWDDDGHLATLAMWGWVYGAYAESGGERSPERFGDIAGWREFEAAGRTLAHDPFHGGSNALHLGHSTIEHPAENIEALLLRSDEASRKAVLVVGHAAHWHAALHDRGARLPDLGERSWHVDVVVRPVGWLGTFRRSRATGEWFQGKHSTHVRGWSAVGTA